MYELMVLLLKLRQSSQILRITTDTPSIKKGSSLRLCHLGVATSDQKFCDYYLMKRIFCKRRAPSLCGDAGRLNDENVKTSTFHTTRVKHIHSIRRLVHEIHSYINVQRKDFTLSPDASMHATYIPSGISFPLYPCQHVHPTA